MYEARYDVFRLGLRRLGCFRSGHCIDRFIILGWPYVGTHIGLFVTHCLNMSRRPYIDICNSAARAFICRRMMGVSFCLKRRLRRWMIHLKH